MDQMVLEGILSDIIYYNEDNGYVIGNLETIDDVFCIKGIIPFVKEGDRLRVAGRMDAHAFYGDQLNVTHVEHVKPSDRDEVYKYLASGVITGIGEATAELMIQAFGDQALEVIEKTPERLLEINGIGPKKLDQIVSAYHEQYAMRDYIMYFQSLGLSVAMAMRIFKVYGLEATIKIEENPYLLATEIQGVGFKLADEIAMKMGIEPGSPFRIESGILHMLMLESGSGHTYQATEALSERVSQTLRVPIEAVHMQLRDMAVKGVLTLEHSETQGQRAYLPSLYYAEQQVAGKIFTLLTGVTPIKGFYPEAFVAEYEKEKGIVLAKLQKTALSTALETGVFILTGGPGTGKTTLINAMISAYESLNKRVLLCAPTGRAAKRMSEATQREAKTIHRLLEFQGENQFGKNDQEPLSTDVVVVDEISMVDVVLMYRLLDAITPGTHLVLVGDSDQLPSVGPGSVLKDLLSSETVPHVALNEIFRQSEASLIAVNAHKINHGEAPLLNVPEKDFFFMARKRAQAVCEEIKQLVSKRLPEYYGLNPSQDIQILSPMKNSEVGVHALNDMLQAVINPPSPSKKERKFGNKLFRTGDKVMQIKNNYNLEWQGLYGDEGMGVFNGDIGYITHIDETNRSVTVLFDGERSVLYDFPSVDELVLAYAITVHKSQGSEFKAVIMPMVYGPPMLMSRNILYTGITRAKELVVLVGDKGAMGEMIARNQEQDRRSGLKDRLAFYKNMF